MEGRNNIGLASAVTWWEKAASRGFPQEGGVHKFTSGQQNPFFLSKQQRNSRKKKS